MGDVLYLTEDKGVSKTILRKHNPDAIGPSVNNPIVDIHYEGKLADNGKVFDSTTVDNSIFSFEIGNGNVIRAFDIALRSMKVCLVNSEVGEVSRIICKPEYAYGAQGSHPDIPPNSTLEFVVELLSCRARKGSTTGSALEAKSKLEELKKQREAAAAMKEEEKKRQEEKKVAAAMRMQEKLQSRKGRAKPK